MSGPLPTDAMDVGSGRRLSLTPDAMWLENWTGGAWVRLRPIAYGEILTVYSYDQRDWGFVGVMALVWLIAVLVLLLLGAVLIGPLAGGNANTILGILVGLVTLAVVGLAIYRVLTVPKKMLRIDTHTGSLIVPRKQPRFFHTLGEHLDRARNLAASLPAQPPAFGPGGVAPPPGMPLPSPGMPPPPPGYPLPPSIGPAAIPPPPLVPPPAGPVGETPQPPAPSSESGRAPWET